MVLKIVESVVESFLAGNIIDWVMCLKDYFGFWMEIDVDGVRDGERCYRWLVIIDGGLMGGGVDWLENRLV